jgi:hypothetical protein
MIDRSNSGEHAHHLEHRLTITASRRADGASSPRAWPAGPGLNGQMAGPALAEADISAAR